MKTVMKIIIVIMILSMLFIGQTSAGTKTITLGHEPQYTWDGVQITELSNISEIPGGYSINWRGMVYNISIPNGYDTFSYPNGTFVSANIFPHINRWRTQGGDSWVEIIPSSRTISRKDNQIFLNMTMYEGGFFNITYTITDRIKYTWDFTSGTNYNYSIDFQIHGAAGIDVNPVTKKHTPGWFNNFTVYDWTDIQEPYASRMSSSVDKNNKILYQRIVLGQMPVGSRIIIDPTIKLQVADTENLGDSYVDQSSPTINYGTVTSFYVKNYVTSSQRGYIKYNLSSIPAGATIDNAVLYLYVDSVLISESVSTYHQVNDSWTETGITWNNQPCPGTGCNATAENTTTVSITGWNSWAVTNMVSNATINGNKNISIFLRTPEASYVLPVDFHSKEYTTDITLRPYLNITYTEAAAGTTPNITSWGNNYTNNDSISFTVPQGTTVRFNLTANQSVNWTSPNSTYLDGNETINGNFTKTFSVVGTNFTNITCSNVNGSCLNWINWTITVTRSTSDITIPANSWGMFNNWSENTNFSSIASNESNDDAFTFYNVTSGEWDSYYPGYSWNSGQVIDKNNSVLGFFNTQATITATTVTPWNTSITAGWNMLYLMGTSNQTLTAICTNMVNCTDIYYYNSTSNDYNNTGTDIQPNQGFLAYVNQTGTWIRSTL